MGREKAACKQGRLIAKKIRPVERSDSRTRVRYLGIIFRAEAESQAHYKWNARSGT